MADQEIWLVGQRSHDPFGDAFVSEELAVETVMNYLFQGDGYWLRKLSEKNRQILDKLKGYPELAIEFYNSVCGEDNHWVITSTTLRTEACVPND